jgi:serine/threonine protein kinase
MELLEGENLTAYNKEGRLLQPSRVSQMVGQICHALDFAHSHNVIHRDIKPANLMFTLDGRIKITDFGIAMNLQGDNTADLPVLGTPSYMSPEQTKGEVLTNQTDFFSLGIVTYELLCGKRPFQGRTLYELMDNIRYSPPPSLLKAHPGLPPNLDLVIQRALEKEPELRYKNGKDFADALESAMTGKAFQAQDFKASRKADLLKAVEFFRPFSIKEVEEIVRVGKFIRYERSQVILKDGDLDTTFFILLKGRVRVIKNNRKVADLTSGACFGEMGAVTRSPRSAHVVAREPSIVLKLDLRVFDRELPDLKMKFYQVFIETLVDRLAMTTRRLSAQDGDTGPSL